ncbi:TatD family hydrolase [Paenibacillus roseipurpureus]|uniref:TatD family hydrolase n=1 Tax=Paenibacillus roseopurpureus TaxID=2918901 RepID=A0AA96RIJ1_9BACL|nr:TatD family hydrolase [Paenibacillus sp. MBLB1832]WNR42156.1 TatD family hydrolase [Paenibacillus sp. MBLB1832]
MEAIDAHIHLDMYSESDAGRMIEELPASQVAALIAVSMNLDSCRRTREYQRRAPNRIYAAYGFHPEQELPTGDELEQLLTWMGERVDEMTAVGEIGLPYYMRKEAEADGGAFDLAPYVGLLERFIEQAAQWNKPVVLHAVYEDADLVCDVLGKYGIEKAHFHWFKGSSQTVQRMIEAGYYISITPDVQYEEEIQTLVRMYPLEQLMVETDGPWPFEGPFLGRATHPIMIHAVIEQIARIKGIPLEETAAVILANTKRFYGLPEHLG